LASALRVLGKVGALSAKTDHTTPERKMIEDWNDMTNAQKAELLGALFLFFVTAVIMGSLYMGWLERRDAKYSAIAKCMHDETRCEFARCVSVVDDIPMTQELSDACP
jgi:hypothetical protein